MSKTRDTGYLANVIQVHDTGVRIMSGSTMLMAVSSSGAVTITGEISGSDAANSLLLSGTGSVGFTTTSSFLVVSASQQQISSSYIALSGSYNTFSGSASTRITENSSSIQQVSSSQQQISSSLLQVSASYISLSGSYNTFSGSASTRTTQIENVYATTGSNSFRANQSITGSLVVSSTITAQTLVVQTVTSSIVYSSGSNIFGSQLSDRQTFTGSVLVTGSLTIAGGGNVSAPTIFGSTIACSPIGCFATSCATSFIGGTMSGTTIYGSTAVCSPVGKFTSCIDAGSGTFSGGVTATQDINSLYGIAAARNGSNTQASGPYFLLSNAAYNQLWYQQLNASNGLDFWYNGSIKLTIASTGAATFSNSIASSISGSGDNAFLLATGTGTGARSMYIANDGAAGIFGIEKAAGGAILGGSSGYATVLYSNNATSLQLGTNQLVRMTIASTGAATFACSVASPYYSFTGAIPSSAASTGYIDYSGGGARFFSVGTSGATKGAFSFYGKGADDSSFIPLTITSTGIACFACQVCAPSGVKFGSGATTLNYYEQGTFTPTIQGSSTAGTGTYSHQIGVYTKIGNLVTTNVWINWTAHTGTGDMLLANFPFTSIGTSGYRASGTFGWVDGLTLTANNILTMAYTPSETKASVTQYPAGGGTGSSVSMDASANLHFSITYQTT